ncbi:MAG TPA: hypothetical protein VI653_07780 [Steroidobacteraceae bacterium]
MDAQATWFVAGPQCDLGSAADAPGCPAKRLGPDQRQELAVKVLARAQPVSDLARELQVSRGFVYRQAHTADKALQRVFAPRAGDDGDDAVLFYLPVTRAWLRQLVLALVLICRSSYRGVIAVFRDLFDLRISLGTVHNIIRSAVGPARAINQSYDLANVRIGAHDEIFQAGDPVLVGVDTRSTFCYLLSPEESRDSETWGVRLLELADRGFTPEAIVADGGKGLRAGQELALPGIPCHGDLFHLLHDLTEVVSYLERRAYAEIDSCAQLEREHARRRLQGKSLRQVGQRLRHAGPACDSAMALYADVNLLVSWLHHDILALDGPCYADRCELYDFVVAELHARVDLCPHRLKPIWRLLKNHRERFLAFAQRLDEGLARLGDEFQVSPTLLRRLLGALSRDERDSQRWTELAAVRPYLRCRFEDVCAAVAALSKATVRASSLVENLNSRLRNHFFLRRTLGPAYLDLLQFFLNHRPLERSDRPERTGKTPAELLTGRVHPHWLEMLGYIRFARA